NDLYNRLNRFLDKGVQVINYKDAIEKLNEVKQQFDEKNIFFGLDLATEHEKYIADKLFGGPVAVINYPKEIKAFYMKQNSDNKTVACFDILVPGIGELDLRRFGQAQSAGFGIGFERLVMYVTGIENIRDAIPFPRTTNNLK
uniref:Aminoacyl-tRNA synthetase class II (D/K/N) domain-containing protein n=1 Tax=Biomphalaria glabrata TaxID=6526 RepID=A0A2C9M5D6_BIOGL